MRQKQVNHARNIWDRAVTILPRSNVFWQKYTYMEEMLGNVVNARQIFERWMQWHPDEQAWQAYINFELRYHELDKVRAIYERFVMCHGTNHCSYRVCTRAAPALINVRLGDHVHTSPAASDTRTLGVAACGLANSNTDRAHTRTPSLWPAHSRTEHTQARLNTGSSTRTLRCSTETSSTPVLCTFFSPLTGCYALLSWVPLSFVRCYISLVPLFPAVFRCTLRSLCPFRSPSLCSPLFGVKSVNEQRVVTLL